jgi:hypothetical protein
MAEINGDEILAKDLNAPSMFANILRARAENGFVVLDLGYVPPLESSEVSVIMPAEVAQMLSHMVNQLLPGDADDFNPVAPPRA